MIDEIDNQIENLLLDLEKREKRYRLLIEFNYINTDYKGTEMEMPEPKLKKTFKAIEHIKERKTNKTKRLF